MPEGKVKLFTMSGSITTELVDFGAERQLIDNWSTPDL